ncbi:MAG TPA: ATP-binding cassette domain-containing protein [Clostridia bacterium]|nr:ATP-binding cassette domain-containing protein [Clostridia bacterium]
MIHENARVLIRTESMSKYYKLENETGGAVKNLDMRILQGEFVVLEGLYGNQKDVFFNCLGCLEKPDEGKYFFDYENIALARDEVLDKIRKNKIGYLFRDFKLIAGLTAAENIGIPMHGLNISNREKRDRIMKALEDLGMEKYAGVKVSALSDASKQLVSLARAVINNPLMIIADEPAASLNSSEEHKLMEHLFRLNREGITIILHAPGKALTDLSQCRLLSFNNGRLLKGGLI